MRRAAARSGRRGARRRAGAESRPRLRPARRVAVHGLHEPDAATPSSTGCGRHRRDDDATICGRSATCASSIARSAAQRRPTRSRASAAPASGSRSSSAAFSGPAIGCASRRASSTSRTREALAHAKADGPMAERVRAAGCDRHAAVDGTAAHGDAGGARRGCARARRRASTRTARSTEGRLKLETLDPRPGAGARSPTSSARSRSIRGTRWRTSAWRTRGSGGFRRRARSNRPDATSWPRPSRTRGARVEIDPDLAEAHSALAFFLACADRIGEAVAAGRLAVAIEPGNWRHQFRLGIAAWGTERLAALQAVVEMYPQLAVHVLRRGDGARRARRPRAGRDRLRQGIAFDGAATRRRGAISGQRPALAARVDRGWRRANRRRRAASSTASSRVSTAGIFATSSRWTRSTATASR